MKKLTTLIFLFIAATVGAQQPVEVVVTGSVTQIKVKEGWWVYADNAALEIDGPTLDDVPGKLSGRIEKIVDPVFESEVSVYKETLEIEGRKGELKLYAGNGIEFLPIEIPIGAAPAGDVNIRMDVGTPLAECGGPEAGGSSGLLKIFLLGLIGGLVALLTPCVFPMVPVTVSFFTNRSGTRKSAIRNGLLYGGSILFIYLAVSLPFHLAGGADPQLFNTISTNVYVNLAFFAIFIFFALSFFGLFEITLPGRFTNVAGSRSNISSFGGIFFMALTLATVSFSCTGPILGSLLVGSLNGANGAWQLTAGLAGFGLALGLPFGLFAMFPRWLSQLPKSGSWLNTVKVFLAFIELGLAFKFLSNADLVAHWGLLKREVFIGIWILITLSLTTWLFSKRTRGRMITGVISLLFALYMLPGLTSSAYARLSLLSGFPPPLSYSVYKGHHPAMGSVEPDFTNRLDSAMALAKKEGKPVMIDFTGWACVNCRKMEEHVWTEPEVASLIEDNFILVSLYVDDRKKLKAEEVFRYQNKLIDTEGKKWALVQRENFKQVTQPLYVLLSPEGKLLNHPRGYTPDKEAYAEWLRCGLEMIKK